MNPIISNSLDYNIENDENEHPWMYERVFGGRTFKQKYGFFYWYDVAICIVPDAIVDCLGDIIRLNKTYGQLVYSEMRRNLWSDNNTFIFVMNQVSARFFGATLIVNLISGIMSLVKCMM